MAHILTRPTRASCARIQAPTWRATAPQACGSPPPPSQAAPRLRRRYWELYLVYDSGFADDAQLDIYLHDVDDPAALGAGDTPDVLGRTRTTASQSWTDNNLNNVATGGGWVQSPDISAVVQEVIDRPGWASGSALAPLLIAKTDVGGERLDFVAYDSNPFAGAETRCYLHGRWSAPDANANQHINSNKHADADQHADANQHA